MANISKVQSKDSNESCQVEILPRAAIYLDNFQIGRVYTLF